MNGSWRRARLQIESSGQYETRRTDVTDVSGHAHPISYTKGYERTGNSSKWT